MSKEEPVYYRSAVTEPREIIGGGITNRTVEYKRNLTEPSSDIRRELDEIERRAAQPRLTRKELKDYFKRELANKEINDKELPLFHSVSKEIPTDYYKRDFVTTTKDFVNNNRDKTSSDEYRYAEASRAREFPLTEEERVQQLKRASANVNYNYSNANNDFNKPLSVRIRELRGEREFPIEHHAKAETEVIRNIAETDLLPKQKPTTTERIISSEIRRIENHDIPAEVSKSTNLNYIRTPTISERLHDIRREREMLNEIQSREAAETKTAELRRERLNNEIYYNKTVVPVRERESEEKLEREREFAGGEYERSSTENRKNAIKREIEEIERRITDKRLRESRREREFPSTTEFERNRTAADYSSRYREEVGVPGTETYIKTVTTTTGPKTQVTDTSDFKRESESDYQRGLNGSKHYQHKKKKQKKNKNRRNSSH